MRDDAFDTKRSEALLNIDWKEKKVEVAYLFATALPNDDSFPYTYIVCFSRRSSSHGGQSAAFLRYRVLRLQMDLVMAWVQFERWETKGNAYR